jgi:hypothetical protein
VRGRGLGGGDERGDDGFVRGRGSGGGDERHREASAQGVAFGDEGEGDYMQTFTEGSAGRYGACVGEGGGLAAAGYGGPDSEDFDAAGVMSEEIDAAENMQGSGARVQTQHRDDTDTAPNSDGTRSSHRSWLDMDHVDPCQPTQNFNVGASTHGQESVHWSAGHSGRVKPVRIDMDEYVEQSDCNVDVVLSLQGQLY